MPLELTNTGVLEAPIAPTDFVGEGVTGISYKVNKPTGDWSNDLPVGESQIGIGGDTFACVTFSALNCLETYLKGAQGMAIDFSDRFTAKMSGTTKQGNYLAKVADSIRHDGLVLERDWGWDRRSRDPEFDWDLFYTDIPDDIRKKGIQFLTKYDIAYEWVDTDIQTLKKHLQQAPLQIVTKVCSGWNQGDEIPVKACGLATQHATMLYKIDGQGYHIFDHYDPFPKVLAPDYQIAYAMKYVINFKTYMLEKGKGKLVRHATKGTYGLNLGDVILDAPGNERAGLLALDILMRDGQGVTLTDQEWNSVPHRPF